MRSKDKIPADVRELEYDPKKDKNQIVNNESVYGTKQGVLKKEGK